MKRNAKKELCARGHFYDANKFTSCPHCAKLEKRTSRFPEAEETAEVYREAPDMPQKGAYWTPEDIKGKKKLGGGTENPAQVEEGGYTRSMLNVPVFGGVEEKDTEIFQEPSEPVQKQQVTVPDELPQSPLFTEDKRAQTFNMKTSTIYDVSDTQPVVAWLVGIKGVCLGQSFTLKTGRNQIGRHPAMDVNILGDTQISRSHCIITFEPNQQRFFLQPGEGSGITYCNDDAVLIPRELTRKDIIKIGASELLFVPLCDGEFRWENYIDGKSV